MPKTRENERTDTVKTDWPGLIILEMDVWLIHDHTRDENIIKRAYRHRAVLAFGLPNHEIEKLVRLT